jgi:hypothetical protein
MTEIVKTKHGEGWNFSARPFLQFDQLRTAVFFIAFFVFIITDLFVNPIAEIGNQLRERINRDGCGFSATHTSARIILSYTAFLIPGIIRNVFEKYSKFNIHVNTLSRFCVLSTDYPTKSGASSFMGLTSNSNTSSINRLTPVE